MRRTGIALAPALLLLALAPTSNPAQAQGLDPSAR